MTVRAAERLLSPLARLLSQTAEQANGKVMSATSGLFSHGPHPLDGTLGYPGDPGLFGPDSMTWTVVGDTSVFVGGIRALIVQAAHPEVAAGVAEHSRYRADPLGRLSRTAAYVTATSFGAMPEVDRALNTVRSRHRPVKGRSHRDQPYAASDPSLAAWVHNTLTESFLTAYRVYGPTSFTEAEADRYVAEQTRVGRLLESDPLPATAADLSAWIEHHPGLEASPGSREAIAFLRRPPLPVAIRPAYSVLFRAAAATLPTRISRIIGIDPVPGGVQIGRAAVAALRWSLGSSPDWRVALIRTAAAPPAGVTFRQPLPVAAGQHDGC